MAPPTYSKKVSTQLCGYVVSFFRLDIGLTYVIKKSRRHGGPVIDDINIMSFSLDFAEFLLPIDRQTRFTIRERPIVAAQSNVADTHATQPRRRWDPDRRRANGLTNAARRLQQVGESLERLNDVISEGASLESLNTAVEELRAGLGRLDANIEDGERRPDRLMRQRVDDTNDGTADRQENEVMERLEVLVRIFSHFTETLTTKVCVGGPNVGFDTSSADERPRRIRTGRDPSACFGAS
jgi:hypothetical protein